MFWPLLDLPFFEFALAALAGIESIIEAKYVSNIALHLCCRRIFSSSAFEGYVSGVRNLYFNKAQASKWD